MYIFTHTQRALSLALTLLALCTSACSDSGSDCYDCGGCGIAGPVAEDFLVVQQTGTDAKGVPTVLVATWVAGTCKSDPSPAVFVHYESSAVSTETITPEATLNTSTATTDNNGNVTWSGANLAMSYTKPDAMTVEIVFKEAGKTTTVTCHANPKEPAVCTVKP